MQKIQVVLDEVRQNCDCYIAAVDGFVSEIILYSIISRPHGDVCFGAYYGSVGGGVNDGGFFIVDVENSTVEHLDYDEVDSLVGVDSWNASALDGLMQVLWTLVEEEEGDLTLTELGSSIYVPGEDGIWMDADFDGDFLDKVSKQWRIGLNFER